MKRITIVLTLIFCFGSIWSNPIDTITAKRVAANFYRQNNVIGVKNGQTLRLQRQAPEYVVAPIDTVFTGFYVLNSINGDGFVIVSSDNNVMPILGYSNDRSMDINNMPLAFRDWLLGYEMEIRSARMDETLVSDEARREWSALLAGQDLPNRSTRSVPPLLTTTWSQEWPYNVACPNDASASGMLNGHVYTGCVATAMAQVMKYWEHPQGGVGSHTYTHPIYGTLSSNFESLIAWNEMLDSYSANGSYTVMQVSAISSLMRMCGVSVEMNYDTQVSLARLINNGYSYIPSAETALKTYFDYSANLRGILKSNYSNPQWINLLKNELDSGRVILYGGTDPEVGGHAFVCDGYSENYFHFNWGWNGSSDCYCLVTSLSPQNSSANYSNQQHAVIGISPTNQAVHPNYDLVMNSTLTSSSQSYQFGSTVTITGSVANTGNAAFNGYIYAIVATINGDIVSRVPIYANISANQCVNQTFTIPGGLPLAPGQYFVCLTSSTNPNNVTAERLVRDDLSHRNFVEFSVEYESSIETFSNFTLSSEVIYPGQSITVNVDILNAGTSTFSGVVSVALVSSEGSSVGSIVQHIQQHNLSSNSLHNYHYANGLDFTGTITAPAGNYFLALLWKESSSADWRYAGSGRDYMNPVRIKVSEQPLADMYEVNNTSSTAFELSAIFSDDIIFVNTDGANFHTQSDVDYYKITLPSGFVYSAIPVLEDMYYNNDISYSVDAKLYYSVNNTSSWVGPIDLNENILSYQQYEVTLNNGGAVYYKVVPTYAK